jgi:hypothetical protein
LFIPFLPLGISVSSGNPAHAAWCVLHASCRDAWRAGVLQSFHQDEVWPVDPGIVWPSSFVLDSLVPLKAKAGNRSFFPAPAFAAFNEIKL